MMLQQVMTKPGEIIFQEVPVPEVKDDQVLVKSGTLGVCAIGYSCVSRKTSFYEISGYAGT